MKKLIAALVLITGILPQLCAQPKTNEDKTYEIPENVVVSRRFYVDLGRGNKMMIELTDITDLQRISNMDSLLTVLISDLKTLEDSLPDPTNSIRIDYAIDASGRKKIRLQRFPPKGDNYLLNNGQLSSLKINQDTVNIVGVIVNPPKPQEKINLALSRYYHIAFYLNNFDELPGYRDGSLTEKIAAIQNNINTKWPLIKGGSSHYLKIDESISTDRPKGFTAAQTGDFIAGMTTVNIQNYKNYFVPSFSVGIRLTLSNRARTFKWEPGLFWEPHFLFAKDAQGKLKTYRNDFLTLTYGQGGITDHDSRKDFSFSAVFSIGYLIHRDGDFIEKNTFRFGAGKLKLSKTTIEPSLYFNRFFKGVTPGIRISQSF